MVPVPAVVFFLNTLPLHRYNPFATSWAATGMGQPGEEEAQGYLTYSSVKGGGSEVGVGLSSQATAIG